MRNGGHLGLNEKWYFGNEKLEVVNMYKYLGVYFTTRLTFSPTLNDLADRARKGMLAIMKLLWSIGEHSPETFFKMFDCLIQPILTYGSEVWGLSDNQESIERVHLSALKRFLGVNSKSPRHLILNIWRNGQTPPVCKHVCQMHKVLAAPDVYG